MKYLYIIILIIVLSCGCIDNLDYKLTDDEKRFITELKSEYDKENVSKPYSEIHVVAVQRYDNYISVSGTVEIYNQSGYPFHPVTEIDIEHGIGSIEFNESNYSVYSHMDYFTVFNGRSDFYDKWYMDKEYAPLLHHVLIDDIIPTRLLFEDIVKVGVISDPLNESDTTGSINGQINISGSRNNKNELQVGDTDTPQNGDIIYFNKTNSFDGIFHIDIWLQFTGNHAYIKKPVIAFIQDYENPFEGDEFERVIIEHITGDPFEIGWDKDITDIVNTHGVLPIADEVECGRSGHFRLIFVCKTPKIHTEDGFYLSDQYDNLVSGNDFLHIYIDDLGDYRNRDILFYEKAKPSDVITIGVRE